MLSNEEFRSKLQDIDGRFEQSGKTAIVRRDQELARLADESDWAPQMIAECAAKGLFWAQRYLQFGRFLRMMRVEDLTLTEFRFRYFLKCTHGTEAERFDKTRRAIERDRLRRAGAPVDLTMPAEGMSINAAVLSFLADGAWHDISEIETALCKTLGARENLHRSAIMTLSEIRGNLPAGRVLESKRGAGPHCKLYRLIPTADPRVLYERVMGIILEIKATGAMDYIERIKKDLAFENGPQKRGSAKGNGVLPKMGTVEFANANPDLSL